MEYPQNVVIPGLSAKSFCIRFTHVAKDIESEIIVMKDVAEVCRTIFGDDFKVSIISAIPESHYTYTDAEANCEHICVMVVHLPRYYWLQDMTQSVSVFQKYVANYISPNVELTIYNSHTPLSLQAPHRGIYHFFYKDGKFTKKQLIHHVYEMNDEGDCKEVLNKVKF